MIRAMCSDGTGGTRELGAEELPAALADHTRLLWTDLSGPREDIEPILREVFRFDPLAIEDALVERHAPKLDDWGDYVYIVMHAVLFDEEEEGPEVCTVELDLFLGPNFVVTHHAATLTAVETVWRDCQRDGRKLEGSATRLCHRLVDALVDQYAPAIEALDDTMREIEAQVITDPDRDLLERIFGLRQSVLNVRRILVPQQEVLNKLFRNEYRVVDPAERKYFRDANDHLVRIGGVNHDLLFRAAGALELHLLVVSNEMTMTMRTLTVITLLLMPLGILTGFFGMNFFGPTIRHPFWTGNALLAVVTVVMIGVPLALYVWLRRRL